MPLGNMRTSAPIWAFLSIVTFVGSMVALTLTGHDNSVLVPVLLSQIPSVVAALFSERAARDIRNGIVEEKAQSGAHAALNDPATMSKIVSMLETHVDKEVKNR